MAKFGIALGLEPRERQFESDRLDQMSNRGRSTTGGPAVPYYPGTPVEEAAKHLRLMVTRFLAKRASLKEIEEAMAMLRQAVNDKEPE